MRSAGSNCLSIIMLNKPSRMPSVSKFSSLASNESVIPEFARRLSKKEKRKNRRGKQNAIFNQFPFPYHEEITCVVDDIANLGYGVCKVDISHLQNNTKFDTSNNKWVILVPTVLPGEEILVRIYKNHKSYSEADLVRVITPSPDRIKPKCQYFNICGGCQYQMAPLDLQRKWKRNQVKDVFTKIGKLDFNSSGSGTSAWSTLPNIEVDECIGTSHEYEYRTKLTPHYDSPKAIEDLKIGFQRRGTKSMIDIEQCIIASKPITRKYITMRKQIKTDMIENGIPKKGSTLLFREGTHEYVEMDHNKFIKQQVKDTLFSFKAGEFFQNNAYVLPLMVDKVIEALKGDNCNYFIDTYCGSGLFSLTAYKHFIKCYGVEISAPAIDAAKDTAIANNITNVEFLQGSSEKIFNNVKDLNLNINETAVLIDPPRKGCDEQFLSQLSDFQPKKIVYVSCDPSTQARDTRYILDCGKGYKIRSITPVDLFPQTRHIENIVCFVRD